MAYPDPARFYTIAGQLYPSVTTVCRGDQQARAGPLVRQEERRHFETALLYVLSQPGARDPEWVLGELAQAVIGVKAADRAKREAATIGTAAHALIEYHLRVQLGEDPGPRPVVPDPALWAFEAWRSGPARSSSSRWPSSASCTTRSTATRARWTCTRR